MHKLNPETSITVCACASRNIMNKSEITKLVSAMENAGFTVKIVRDLCKTAISDVEQMAEIAATAVVACYPRAVKSIFDRAGLKPANVFDIRNNSSEHILNEIGISQPAFSSEKLFPEFLPDEEQEAWYPAIDNESCTNCGKCHDFCLFGVYSIDEGTVKVAQPRNCKTNCPACARVCPSKAIIFPKYEKSPINGGLLDEEQFSGTDTKVLYNTALKHKLEERRAKISLLRKK